MFSPKVTKKSCCKTSLLRYCSTCYAVGCSLSAVTAVQKLMLSVGIYDISHDTPRGNHINIQPFSSTTYAAHLLPNSHEDILLCCCFDAYLYYVLRCNILPYDTATTTVLTLMLNNKMYDI